METDGTTKWIRAGTVEVDVQIQMVWMLVVMVIVQRLSVHVYAVCVCRTLQFFFPAVLVVQNGPEALSSGRG